jgi:hypothetical protein
MYPVLNLTHILNILDKFSMGVTIWYQSRSIQIVPWVIRIQLKLVYDS